MFIIMDNNFDLGLIKIPLSVFKELYESENNFKNETLEKKANELISNYKCFVSNYDAKSLWEKKKIIAAQKRGGGNKNNGSGNSNNSNNRTRPFVLLIDLNDDAKYKKEFTSFLNKLTDINKEVIYNKITLFIKILDENKLNTLFDILINFIKVSSNNIYIDVLYLFPENYINEHINNYCNEYLNNKDWMPNKEFIIDNKILYNNNNYDNYCKFVKIKKQSISILKALININKKLNKNNFFTVITNDISESIDLYIKDNQYKHITEFLLEQILLTLEYLNNETVVKKIKEYNLTDLDYSTKFKILKITEKL
jgi:hypothetical protein